MPRHIWNIVESGVKHHQTNKQTNKQTNTQTNKQAIRFCKKTETTLSEQCKTILNNCHIYTPADKNIRYLFDWIPIEC